MKDARKVALVRETGGLSNVCERMAPIGQLSAGEVEPKLTHVIAHGTAKVLAEFTREVVGANVVVRSNFIQRQRLAKAIVQ